MNNKNTDSLILLVEDTELSREVISMQLSTLGYSVIAAADGLEALKLWHQHYFSMILTDCHMPVMDGFKLTEAIRKEEDKENPHIPIIALTANTVDEECGYCERSGMDECLTKPIELDVLEQLLKKWISPASNSGNG